MYTPSSALSVLVALLLASCADIKPQQYDSAHPASPSAREAPVLPETPLLQSYQSNFSLSPESQQKDKPESNPGNTKGMDQGSGQNQVDSMPGMNMPGWGSPSTSAGENP